MYFVNQSESDPLSHHTRMAEAASVNFTLGDKIAKLEDLVYTLSQTLEAQQITQGELGDVRPSIRSIRDRDITELNRKWTTLKPPCMTFQEYTEYTNLFLKDQHDRNIQRERDRQRLLHQTELSRRGPQLFQHEDVGGQPGPGYLYHEDFANLGPNPAVNTETSSNYRPERFISFDRDRAVATDLSTLISFERPLQWNRTVSLDYFSEQIIFFPQTEIPDLVKCFNNILVRCEFLGFLKEQAAQVFKLFVEKYFPSYAFVLRAERTPSKVFEVALALIDSNEVLSKVNSLFNNFKRGKNQTIKECYFSFLTLQKIRLTLKEPGLTEEQVTTKSQRIVTNQLSKFLSPDMSQLYNNYIAQQHKNGQLVEPVSACRFIGEMESQNSSLAPAGDISYHDDASEDSVNAMMQRVTRSVSKKKSTPLFKGLTRSRKERSDKGKSRNVTNQKGPQRSSTPVRGDDRHQEPQHRSTSRSSAGSQSRSSSREGSPARISGRSSSAASSGGRSTSREDNTKTFRGGFHSRQSSKSRERNVKQSERWNQKASKYNKKISGLQLFCNKCGKNNHSSRKCQTYEYSKTKCEYCKDLYHLTSLCKQKPKQFWEKKN